VYYCALYMGSGISVF
nr:immunoglobulin light chain junction region [Macaca mulatta]MOY05264.1 immunoglobulin light chain junction region [Macaca mulatta]MOY05488.1 immunoglobulin light chain junction region [Macaca mulatta]MOY05705.1 immunoglobulin light chain junction region [Macaca mulatta]MOY06014.1 immunoglobulin light chain junction region [Macaca mulatta]